MILVDYSGVIHAAVAVELQMSKATVVDEQFLRHLILNVLSSYNNKYKERYGEMVLCLDSHHGTWRKEFFPYYKASRKDARKASGIDWTSIFESLNKIIDEIRQYLPYKVILVDGLEGDDIIAILAKHAKELTKENILGEMEHPVLIISNDKDMVQLEKFSYVKRFVPREKKMAKSIDYKFFMIEHVLRGDTIDGIPNIKSDADTFVCASKRQAPITKKFIKEFLEQGTSVLNDNELARYNDNRTLIDFEFIPDKYNKHVLEQFEQTPSHDKNKLFSYFIEKGLRKCAEKIHEFY